MEAKDKITVLKKEVSRLSALVAEKEMTLQSTMEEKRENETQRRRDLQEKENAVAELKLKLGEKSKMIEDLVAAMEAEEASRKCIQKNLERSVERNKHLESDLSASHLSIERAVSEAQSAKDAYAVMRQKADTLRHENSTLLNRYGDWASGVVNESREKHSKHLSSKTAAHDVVARQRMKSGKYSPRLAEFLRRDESSKVSQKWRP